MRSQKEKHPNAYKHGVFSRTAIVPGEDPNEFEALHLDLVREWMPDGATEEEAVLCIAEGMWRKCRVQRLIEFEFEKNTADPSLPSYNEHLGLSYFANILRYRPMAALKEDACKFLTRDMHDFLQKSFRAKNSGPRQNGRRR